MKRETAASVEGSLVHELTASWANHQRNEVPERFKPRAELKRLIAEWTNRSRGSPRFDAVHLAGKLRFEYILSAFAEVQARLTLGPVPKVRSTLEGCSRTTGAEVWIKDPKSKLRIRADIVTKEGITDIKTGAESDSHAAQLQFYAAIYLAWHGRPPASLSILYTVTSQMVTLPVPPIAELEDVLEGLRGRVSATEAAILKGDFAAKPQPDRCRKCNVRGLCEVYRDQLLGAEPLASFCSDFGDYAISDGATWENVSSGVYVRAGSGDQSVVLFLPTDFPVPAEVIPQRVLVTALRRAGNSSGTRLTVTDSSEIYVTA